MQTFVNIPSGRCVVLNVNEPHPTARDVVSHLRDREGYPEEEIVLLRASRVLSHSAPISDKDCLDVLIRVRGGLKGKCGVEECKHRPALVVGDCKYCTGHFCSEHRLPETHSCTGLAQCKEVHFNKNKDKLLREKCVASKV